MSEIKVDTLTGKTSAGDITVTSEGGAATMQLQQGLAKSWVHADQYQGGSSTAIIVNSFNSSSITDDGTGLSTIAFTNNMSNANYSAHCTHANNIVNSAVGAFAAGSYRLDARNDAGTYSDEGDICGTIHGDLA